jgi:8-oxo-dGTP pyrophosphatase MutT (NUDIX family)
MAEARTIISCGIYLFNRDNKLLLEHPTGHKPNVWTIPKGRMDVGETDYFEVAKRELTEETGVILNDLNIIKVEEFEMIRYRETNKYLKSFFVKIDSDLSGFELNCISMVYRNGVPSFPEVDGYKWVTIEEARKVLNEFQYSNLDRCDELVTERFNHLISFEKYKK